MSIRHFYIYVVWICMYNCVCELFMDQNVWLDIAEDTSEAWMNVASSKKWKLSDVFEL